MYLEIQSTEFDDWLNSVGIATPVYVYIMYTAYDELLYVGISNNLRNRLSSHYRDKKWISEVARIDVEEHPDEAAARDRERFLIEERGPVYNIVYQDEGIKNVLNYFSRKMEEKCPGATATVKGLINGRHGKY